MFIFLFLLVAVLIWMAVTFRSRMQVRDCRWRENRAKDGPLGRYYLCVNCGAETFTRDGAAPVLCLKGPQTPKQ